MIEKSLGQKVYTSEYVKAHCSPSDLWMIVYNKVYDLSLFIESHPGGIEVMLDCGGVDATEAFEDVAHSNDAFAMLEDYYVGELDPREHKQYKSMRAKFREADLKAEKLKKERAKLARQNKRLKNFKKRLETLTMVVLILVVLATVGFYLLLQRFKIGNYNL